MRTFLILFAFLPTMLMADPLDPLFKQLAEAPTAQSAASIEAEIWQAWLVGPTEDDTAQIKKAVRAMNQGEWTLAMVQLNQIIEQSPEFTEAWNRRATLHFMLGDFDSSIDDIEQVLKREPRHFGAWSGLGMIMERTGRQNAALKAYERVLQIYPASVSSQQRIEAIEAEMLENSI